jgi:hypothetical protein
VLLLEAGPNFAPNAYPPGAVLLAGFPDPALSGSPDICLILTLRADFYGRALRHRPLADALQGHVENLGPMNRQELQAAIRRAAGTASVLRTPDVLAGAVASTTAGKLRRSALTATRMARPR